MPPPTAAIIGTGFIGPVHLEALRRLGIPVKGILGSTQEKSLMATKKYGLAAAYKNLDEILIDNDVDVVHIASPNHLHFEQSVAVLKAGKHVICEKPLALNSVETAQLVELSRKSQRVAAVCYNIRFYPLCQEARARLRKSQLGRVFHITGSYVQDWLALPTDFNWRVTSDRGGELRAIADIGTHWLDLVQFITGQKVTSVCADLQIVWPRRFLATQSQATFQNQPSTIEHEEVSVNTEDFGAVLLEFDQGARGVFHVSQTSPGRKNCLRFEIAAEKGTLAWNSESPNKLWLGKRSEPNSSLIRDPSLLSDEIAPLTNYPGGHNEGFPDTFKQLFRSVYDYIQVGDLTKKPDFPSFADGHREVVLCEAINKSAEQRRWINLTNGLES